MQDATDEAIAALVQRGDIEQFGILVDRYRAKIQRYARRFLFTADDSEDIVQEAFIKAYVNIRSFDVNRSFSPWMYRIAHNECINAMKKKGRERMSFLDFDEVMPQLQAPESADGDFKKEELRTMLDASLGALKPKYREPLVLYYFEGMEYKEIADILRIPVSTVGVRLKRGRALLQSMIQKKEIHYGTD